VIDGNYCVGEAIRFCIRKRRKKQRNRKIECNERKDEGVNKEKRNAERNEKMWKR
jgi:hypothetical protein